jgi:prepilin-type N-terminal cleavage/methylation domain-containing protein
MTHKHILAKNKFAGFSIVELMVVVAIIGLLSVIAWPSFQRVQRETTAARLGNDFRVYGATFETYALEQGDWAPDGDGNALPETILPYFSNSSWSETPPTGGFWGWQQDRLMITAAVALVPTTDNIELFIVVDRMLDDGNLTTGQFIKASDRYVYILER